MTFLHQGSFARGLKPIPARVWISFMLTGKSVEQTAELLQIYNESCVFGGNTK